MASIPLRRLALLLVLALVLLAPSATFASEPAGSAALLSVHFFDVGQGDAALIESPTGKTVLIDGGPPEAGEALVRRVQALVHGPVDLVLLTHPHLDHLGGLAGVLRTVGARRFMDPGFNHPGKAYTELLETVERLGIPYVQPTVDPGGGGAPVVIGLGGGAALTVLWPRRPAEPYLRGTRSDVNSNSIVARVTFGKTALLFAGDAEPETELHLLEQHAGQLAADLLKVGHHGSHHSTTQAWLRAVHPTLAIISCGAHNDFGHPGPETLERLRAVGARVYRTDQDGELSAVSDGTSVKVHGERTTPSSSSTAPTATAPPPSTVWSRHSLFRSIESFLSGAKAPTGFVASRRSAVFHRPDCAAAAAIEPENRVYFSRREDAARVRRPAKDCHP